MPYYMPSVVLILCLMLGCSGSGSDDNDHDIDQATLQEVETALGAVVNETTGAVHAVVAQLPLTLGRQQVTATQESVNLQVACLENGQLRVAGQATDDDPGFTLAATVLFMNCDGLNGTLTGNVEGLREVTADGTEIGYNATLNGTVTNAGSLTFDQVVIAASRSAIAGDTTGAIDGNLTATCGPERLTCTMDALVFPQDPVTVRAILAASCQRN
jgi:hypothetical protein